MKRKSYEDRIRQAHFLIGKNLDKPLDIAWLASEAAFSMYHFHRIYRAMIGETVAETHRRLRLERAAEYLVISDFSVTRIALEAGYENPPAFSRAFKARFSLAPAEYRRKGRNQELIANNFICPTIVKEKIMIKVNIETRPATIIYAVRHIGSYFDIGKAYAKLWQWIEEQGLTPQVKLGYGVYYDDPTVTPIEECRSDAGVELAPPYPAETQSIHKIELSEGKYACYRHIGSYSKIHQAYNLFYGQWLPTSGYECADAPVFEIYRNNPYDTAEDQLITDLYMQLKD